MSGLGAAIAANLARALGAGKPRYADLECRLGAFTHVNDKEASRRKKANKSARKQRRLNKKR